MPIPQWLLKVVTCLLITVHFTADIASANDYPNRPIKLVFGYPAGGAGDVVGRLVGEHMSRSLGQSLVMENRAGAGGTIATAGVARAEPDGYTIQLVIESHAINASLFNNLTYDVLKDFAPIGMIGRSPLLLVVNEKVPAKDLKEFLALAKQTEGGLSIAHFGRGSPQYAAMLGLSEQTQIKFKDVTYRGGAPAINDLLGGHIQAFFMTQGSARAYTTAGQIRAIAAAAKAPLPLYPEIPTLPALGIPLEAEHWFGMVAPAKTPTLELAKLERALGDALKAPEVHARASELGLVLTPLDSKGFGQFIEQQVQKWGDFNRRNNLQGAAQ